MSPEVIYTGATVIGAIVGAVAEQQAVKKAAIEQEALTYPALETAIEQDSLQTDANNNQLSRLRRASRFMIKAALPVSLAAAFGIEAYSFTPVTETHKSPAEYLVVDDSGSATPVINEIQQVVAQFDNPNAQAIVGNTGQIRVMPVMKFKSYSNSIAGQPAGEAPLNQQMTIALDNVKNANHTSGNQNGAVVAIVNGNSVGDIPSLITVANTQNTPVNVVNVERAGTSENQIKMFKRLASLTGGHFWNATSQNLNSVAKDVKAKTIPEITPGPSPDRWPERATGVLALLAAMAVYGGRRRLILGNDYKGE